MALPDQHVTITNLLAKLFEPEQRRFHKEIERINRANREALGLKAEGFLYNGGFYFTPSMNPTTERHPLHLSLHNEMFDFIVDRNNVHADRDQIKTILFLLANNSHSIGDFRNALPECMVDIAFLPPIPVRSNTEAHTLQGNERHMRQYLKALPKMEYYSAARLIY